MRRGSARSVAMVFVRGRIDQLVHCAPPLGARQMIPFSREQFDGGGGGGGGGCGVDGGAGEGGGKGNGRWVVGWLVGGRREQN